jgi:hypothetical protein
MTLGWQTNGRLLERSSRLGTLFLLRRVRRRVRPAHKTRSVVSTRQRRNDAAPSFETDRIDGGDRSGSGGDPRGAHSSGGGNRSGRLGHRDPVVAMNTSRRCPSGRSSSRPRSSSLHPKTCVRSERRPQATRSCSRLTQVEPGGSCLLRGWASTKRPAKPVQCCAAGESAGPDGALAHFRLPAGDDREDLERGDAEWEPQQPGGS